MRFVPSNPLLHLRHRRYLCTLPLKLKNLNYRHRPRALQDARRALIEYLHSTRSLPFSHADNIVSNSPFSLSSLVAEVPFPHDIPPSAIPSAIRRHLRYRPVNEFDFFFESIGLPPSHHPDRTTLPLFLSDDPSLLSAISALAHFGFPWTRLGILYAERPSIFLSPADALLSRLRSFEDLGFFRTCIIAICLAFPSALTSNSIDRLFQDLKTVLVDFDVVGYTEEHNVEVLFTICKRIRVFYDLGVEMGAMGELMRLNRRIFLDELLLVRKLNFFRKLGVREEEAGQFVLQHSELLNLDLENPSISMPEYLKHVGLEEKVVASLALKYPYVMGKNRLGNLPSMMGAMDLHDWFLGKIGDEGNFWFLSPDYAHLTSYDKKMKDEFLKDIEKVKSNKKNECIDARLEFMIGVGFGENKYAAKAVCIIESTREQLQERLECLLGMGLEYTMLCRMVKAYPNLLNQSTDMIKEKVGFLCNDLGYPLEYLDSFPAFLSFDLENRIKPKYRFLHWLKKRGLLCKLLAPATLLINSDKWFIVILLRIHLAAPKQWLESFSSRNDTNGNGRIISLSRPCQVRIKKT